MRVRLPAEVSEQHARVEEHAVAELAETREEALRPDLAIEEAQRGASLARRIAAGGLHAALFRQHAHATRRLRLEIRPDRSADATGDDELALRCRDEPHERVDAIAELALPGVERSQLRWARGMSLQDRCVGRGVDVEKRRRGTVELARREAALLVQPARQGVVGGRKVDDGEGRSRREGDEVRRVVVVRQHQRLSGVDLLTQTSELRGAHEGAGARTDRRDTFEPARARETEQLLAKVERIGARSDDVCAAECECAFRLGVGGHRDERREARLARAREDDGADRDLDRIEAPLGLGWTAAAEENDEGRRHRRDGNTDSTRSRKSSASALSPAAAITRTPPSGTLRRTKAHCGSLQSSSRDGSTLMFAGWRSQVFWS